MMQTRSPGFEDLPCNLIYQEEENKNDCLSVSVRNVMQRRRRKQQILNELQKQEEELELNNSGHSVSSATLPVGRVSRRNSLTGSMGDGIASSRRRGATLSRSLSMKAVRPKRSKTYNAHTSSASSTRSSDAVNPTKSSGSGASAFGKKPPNRSQSFGYSKEQKDRMMLESIRASVQKRHLNREQIVQNAMKLDAELKAEENALAIARSGAVDEAMIVSKNKLHRRSGSAGGRLVSAAAGSCRNLGSVGRIASGGISLARKGLASNNSFSNANFAINRSGSANYDVSTNNVAAAAKRNLSGAGLAEMRAALQSRIQRPISPLPPRRQNKISLEVESNEASNSSTSSAPFSPLTNDEGGVVDQEEEKQRDRSEGNDEDISSSSSSFSPLIATPEQQEMIDRHFKQIQLHMRARGLVTGLGLAQIIREVTIFDMQ